GAQVIAMKKLNMADTTLSRSFICRIWPKLPSERVEEFTYQDDDEFKVIRRKLLRWMVDNAVALCAAKPVFPPGFNNRVRRNWKMLLAIADLAAGKWPKRRRKAALEVEVERDEASEGIRLFAGLRDVWGKQEKWSSADLCTALVAHPSGEWADFRGKGPISPHQLAAMLREYGIRPIHGGKHGFYRRAQFEDAWARLLQKPT